METRERQKKIHRHRINWLDIGLLLLLLIFAASFIVKYFPNNSGAQMPVSDGNGKVTIEYTVQIDKLPSDLVLALKTGEAVIDIDSKMNIGILSSLPMLTSYQENVYNEQSGGIEIVSSDKYATAYLTVTAEATENNYGYYVNGKRIAVGSWMNIRTADLEAAGKCIGLEVRAEQ